MSEPPSHASHAAAEGGGTSHIEATLARQRMRWRSGSGVLAEEILSRDDALRADPDAVLDLLYNEILLRRECGESPTREEYSERFPGVAKSLGLLFDVDEELDGDAPYLSIVGSSVDGPGVDSPTGQLNTSGAATLSAPRGGPPSDSDSAQDHAPRFVASSSVRGTIELHTLLQRRLRFLSILLTVLYLQAGPQLQSVWRMGHWNTFRLHMALVWVVFSIVASIAVFLLLRRTLISIRWLRTIEGVLFLCPIVQTTSVLFDLT